MTTFDPDRFEEKYVHYFDEIEAAYSNAYDDMHGNVDSQILKVVDRRILAESEPEYVGEGEFTLQLPEDVDERIGALPGDDEAIREVLNALSTRIETELAGQFEFV